MDVFKDQFAVLYCCNALLQVRLGLGAKASWLVFQVFAERLLVFVFFHHVAKMTKFRRLKQEASSKWRLAWNPPHHHHPLFILTRKLAYTHFFNATWCIL